jgi:hypothetical protein
MVNEEYIFSYPRKGADFSLIGYRVHARTGAARWVSLEDVRAQYGDLFPNGHVQARDRPKYDLRD